MKGHPHAPQCGFSAKAVGALNSLGSTTPTSTCWPIRKSAKASSSTATGRRSRSCTSAANWSAAATSSSRWRTRGELHSALGLPAPDRTPAAASTITASRALEMLRDAHRQRRRRLCACSWTSTRATTPACSSRRSDANAIAVEIDGIRVQFDLAQRAPRRGHAHRLGRRRARPRPGDRQPATRRRRCARSRRPKPTRACAPARCAGRRASGGRTRAGRGHRRRLDTSTTAPIALEALPKDTALAFLCHHGGRSQQAAEHFRGLGFREVYNIDGGIDAWADLNPAVRQVLTFHAPHVTTQPATAPVAGCFVFGVTPRIQVNPPPASRYACSSAVLSRPSTRLRCGKRPKRRMTSQCRCA